VKATIAIAPQSASLLLWFGWGVRWRPDFDSLRDVRNHEDGSGAGTNRAPQSVSLGHGHNCYNHLRATPRPAGAVARRRGPSVRGGFPSSACRPSGWSPSRRIWGRARHSLCSSSRCAWWPLSIRPADEKGSEVFVRVRLPSPGAADPSAGAAAAIPIAAYRDPLPMLRPAQAGDQCVSSPVGALCDRRRGLHRSRAFSAPFPITTTVRLVGTRSWAGSSSARDVVLGAGGSRVSRRACVSRDSLVRILRYSGPALASRASSPRWRPNSERSTRPASSCSPARCSRCSL